MITYIPSAEAIERFKRECKAEEANLITGKCQLCVDALLLLTAYPKSGTKLKSIDDLSPSHSPSLVVTGDTYILDLARRCPSVKVIYPSRTAFEGLVDLSLFESCVSLELVRIPFGEITGIDGLRQNLHSLVWIRGYIRDGNNSQLASFNRENGNFNSLRIDEIFWDQFGSWPKLSYLSISQSFAYHVDASTMPASIKTLDLKLNRLSHFSNLANSLTTTLTKLCLDYNSLKELPKLNANSRATLVHLSLRGNLIRFPTGLRDFLRLDYLDLSDNCICDRKRFIAELEPFAYSLKTLLINGNPINSHPLIRRDCQSVLVNLVNLNGKHIPLKNSIPNSSPSPVRPKGDTSIDSARLRKSSITRFVIINDPDDPQPPPPPPPSVVQLAVPEDPNKNYFFGGVSGSYGSFAHSTPKDATLPTVTIAEAIVETDTVVQIEDEGFPTEQNKVEDLKKSSNDKKLKDPVLDDSAEWVNEDLEDENTVFLVELYDTTHEFTLDTNYLFIRIRPQDGLLYEKDCTTGKILQTLDLKVLTRYEILSNTDEQPEAFVLKLLFDTVVISKQVRIYHFLDEESFKSFIELYLSDTSRYKCDEAAIAATTGSGSAANSFDPAKKYSPPWLYMCLRCGNRTHRIITDCPKCNSDLIIKDECVQPTSQPLTPASSSPSEANTLVETSLEPCKEEDIDNETTFIDSDYFKSNIDHYLKLHLEIFISEKVGDELLKLESIEAVCHCQAFCPERNSFQPALVVFSTNYFFFFDYEQTDPKNRSTDRDLLNLQFYRPLYGPKATQFIVSHLPSNLKNIGYWIECNYRQKKHSRRRKTKNSVRFLQLLLFGDEETGKAFLELFFKAQKNSYRLQKISSDLNLVLVKRSIMLTASDEEDIAPSCNNTFEFQFDHTIECLYSGVNIIDDPNPNPFALFMVKSFQFVQNINKQDRKKDIFQIEDNPVLILVGEHILLAELCCNLTSIFSIAKQNRSDSLAKNLRKLRKFQDCIRVKKLLQESLLDLLPDIFIDKRQFLLVLRFRDDDKYHSSIARIRGSQLDDQSSDCNGNNTADISQVSSPPTMIVCEFRIQFFTRNTLIRVTKLIRGMWETNFGISLTISKAIDL